MNTALFVALPIAILVSAIVGGFLFKRNLDTDIQSLAEGCRIIDELLAVLDEPHVAEAQSHLALANSHLTSAKFLRDEGEKQSAFAAVDAGFKELKTARELVLHPHEDDDAE